jgi:hypothetical protein
VTDDIAVTATTIGATLSHKLTAVRHQDDGSRRRNVTDDRVSMAG